MSNEDGIPPTQETTGDSEANRQPDNEYIFANLPNYLINPSKKGDDADFLSNVSEDSRETGLGYDSDDHADEVEDIDDEANLVWLFRVNSITGQDANQNIVVDSNMMEFPKGFKKNVNPESLQIHNVPYYWEVPSPAVEKGEPPFESIDNPGEWGYCSNSGTSTEPPQRFTTTYIIQF